MSNKVVAKKLMIQKLLLLGSISILVRIVGVCAVAVLIYVAIKIFTVFLLVFVIFTIIVDDIVFEINVNNENCCCMC